MKKYIIVLIGLVVLSSCAKNALNGKNADITSYSVEAKDVNYQAKTEEAASAFSDKNRIDLNNRKLIKTGHIRFASDDVKQTRNSVNELLIKYNGYISQENEISSSYNLRQELTVKIPKDNFDVFLNDLAAGVKKIDEKHIDVEDVTEEFIDIEAALKIKKETEAGYLKLLNQAKTVKDILEIQYQVQIIRSEIESIEGRLKYLEASVNFSTLNISFYQRLESDNKTPSFLNMIVKALKGGVQIFAEVFIHLLYAWVFILIFVFFIVIFIKRRKRK